MLNETMLDVFGSFEMNQTYPFMQGWNLIPVICNAPVDAQALFSTADLIVAKEVAGTGILWPEYGINTLNSLLPGRAYYALAGSAGSIQFPAYAKDNSQIVNTQQVLPAHPWNEIWTTPSSHLIAITSGATENLLQGDVIGVFSQNDNRCYGVTEIADPASGLALTAFADDPETSAKDGLMAGDVFRLELFRPGTMQFFDLVPIFDHSLPNGPEFENEGLSSIIQLKLSPTGIAGDASTGIRIYPNPTDGEFWVEGISGMSEIEITNVLGETIGSYLLESHNRIKIDVSDFQAGIYQVKVVGDKGTVLRKVIKK
nr:T9SS type A sorting domain-containing protein [Bacteroidota bacterium]